MSYTIVTNIYNEAGNIRPAMEMIAAQTIQPRHWVWIDDGSNDNGKGRSEIMEHGIRLGLPVSIFELPPKDEGSLDTIGLAWNEALPHIRRCRAEYLTVVDVDNRYPTDYYQIMLDFLDDNPTFGAISGHARGELRRTSHNPMGGGKVVRWAVIDIIEEFWSFAPDSFLNIKTRAAGYQVGNVDIMIDSTRPTLGYTKAGKYRYGRRLHHAGNSIFVVGYIALRQMLRREHGLQILKGFMRARFWDRPKQVQDRDVRYHYSKRNALRRIYQRVRK